jgi:hypothetical protein
MNNGAGFKVQGARVKIVIINAFALRPAPGFLCPFSFGG